ncbi:transcription factor IIA subunit alpha [Rhizina undulata]
MSNQLVGEVYQRVIEEVIATSVIDFEEAGVNASTLEELRKVWQQKLSDLKVAHFPWDPPPEPAPQATPAAPPLSPSKSQPVQQQPAIKQELGTYDPTNSLQNVGGVRIKHEPGLEPPGVYAPPPPPPQQPAGNPTHDPQLAHMRAQQNIAQRFGTGNPQLQARPPGGGLMLPGLGPNPVSATQQQQQQRPQTNGQQNGIPQHDGAGEEDELIPIEGFGSLSRLQADRIILRRLRDAERESDLATEELENALKSLTIASASSNKKQKKRRRQDAYEAALDSTSSYPYPSSLDETMVPRSRISQVDGDSEEEDEDAINSDLDDPEDDEIDNDDEDEVPQIMLCMYDKVQRTKNKWKCVLKDGVLTINGKEYVFHKANGEYEW